MRKLGALLLPVAAIVAIAAPTQATAASHKAATPNATDPTPPRAVNAKPVPMPTGGVSSKKPVRPVAKGEPLRAHGSSPVGTRAPTSTSEQTQEAYYPYNTLYNPARQVGRLFFQHQNGSWTWCSGSSVASANKSTIVTAGHCVWNGSEWDKSAYFCPAYENGSCKLGAWYVRRFVTTGAWKSSQDSRYDFAIVLTQSQYYKNGTWYSGNVGTVAGTQGIAFNQATNQYRWAFGYPQTDPRWPGPTYDPRWLSWCPQRASTWASSQQMLFISCGMTGGSSGGPWITAPNSNWIGWVESLQSNKGCTGSACVDYDFGPYFGNVVKTVWTNWNGQ
jgi:hypothetical protein